MTQFDHAAIMRKAGWRYDKETNGWRKAREWVTDAQARDACWAAMTGERIDYKPESETVNRITSRAANLDAANDT